MKKLLTILLALWIGIPFAIAQNPVKGKVSNSSGEGLPGVTILVANTSVGTVSDFEGHYALEVPDNSVLVFSFIGFLQREIAISGQSVLNVTLQEDTKSLEEVVVTAIGIKQQKKKLGYATQEVDTDVLSESRTMNLGNALSGQVAGLAVSNPTGMFQSPSFNLRGKRPLIVLDGVPLESDLKIGRASCRERGE